MQWGSSFIVTYYLSLMNYLYFSEMKSPDMQRIQTL